MIRFRNLLLLPALAGLLLAAGCGEEDSLVNPPLVEDPGEQLLANVRSVQQSIIGLVDEARNQLNFYQNQLSPYNPDATYTSNALEDLVEFAGERVWMAALVSTAGKVDAVHPQSIDSLEGANWSGHAEIDSALTAGGLAVGDVYTYGSVRTLLYARSIKEDPAEVEGVLVAGLRSDQIIEQALSFAAWPDSANYELFIVEPDGEIIFNSGDESLFGATLTDSSRFSASQVALGEAMVDPNAPEGFTTFDATGGPGGDGMRRVAWLHAPLSDGHFWSLAITEPLEDES